MLISVRYVYRLRDSDVSHFMYLCDTEERLALFEKKFIADTDPSHFVREYLYEMDPSRLFVLTNLLFDSDKEVSSNEA